MADKATGNVPNFAAVLHFVHAQHLFGQVLPLIGNLPPRLPGFHVLPMKSDEPRVLGLCQIGKVPFLCRSYRCHFYAFEPPSSLAGKERERPRRARGNGFGVRSLRRARSLRRSFGRVPRN
jgi:hypothetical protein